MSENKNIIILALVIFSILSVASIASYRYAKDRTPTIILPGGITYLGPRDTPTPTTPPETTSTITIPDGTKWAVYKGKVLPYSFSYPTNLSLGVFPNDPFDSVTIFWGNTNPQENLLLRVEDLNKIPNMNGYITKPKIDYAKNWWRQYGYRGPGSVTGFTNSSGLVGFRARYEGTQSDNIFFEVPGRSDLVIWMSGKLLDQVTFDKVVDSVKWK